MQFILSIIQAFARGFGFTFGRDAAREAETIVHDEINQ